MTVDKQKLRELASKATPGLWAAVAVSDRAPELPGCRAHYAAAREHALYDQGAARALAADDAAFIAAASPSTVLALLDEIEERNGHERAATDLRERLFALDARIRSLCLEHVGERPVDCTPEEDLALIEEALVRADTFRDDYTSLLAERDAMRSIATQATRERDRLHATLKAVADICIDKGKLRVGECVAEDAPPRAVAKLVEQRDAAIARAEQAERELDALVRSTHAALDAAGVTEEPRVETRIALLHGEVKSIEPRVVEAIAAWLDTWIGKLPLIRLAELAAGIRAGAWRKS